MELKEAFDIIDATLGMFRSFADEIDNRDPKENFLATSVRSEVQNVINVADGVFNPEIECKDYYNYVDGDKEYKMYIVNIRPVCDYIVNEWPSSKAKKIRKLLYVVFRECLDICEEPLKGIIDVAIDEGYSYHMRYNASSQNSRTIESVMLDTIHEMYHALGLTEYAEPESEVNQLAREKADLEQRNRELQDKVNHCKSNIVIADDRKIDVIKVLHAMCKAGLFKMKDGSRFTIKAVMEFFGEILNDNFSEYSSNLSTSKSTAKENTFLEIFDKLRDEAKKYLNKS